MRLFTIGHSNIRTEEFLDLLSRHGVEVLVDVRTAPYSRYCPQFNRPELQQAIETAGLRYHFAGKTLGGKPADERLRGEDGAPDYDKIAASHPYEDGLTQLLALAAEHCVAIMCSEADPAQCHREKLIARSLRARGVEVTHIFPDGSAAAVAQPTLFEDQQTVDGRRQSDRVKGELAPVELPSTVYRLPSTAYCLMPVLLTIGTSKKSLRRFIELLREAKVDAVIDTRRNNTSQLAGYSKKEDLEFLLTEAFRIRYEHRPELAPSEPLLAVYLKERDWDRYSMAFLDEMEAGFMKPVLGELLDRYQRPCLLCACDSERTCHRRLLAEAMAEERPGLEVLHLR